MNLNQNLTIRSHLGNIRLTCQDINQNNASAVSLQIEEENNYYPYGLKMRGFNTGVSSLGNSLAQKYKFNGKEFDESFNETLNTYDFGARNYDPALGRCAIFHESFTKTCPI